MKNLFKSVFKGSTGNVSINGRSYSGNCISINNNQVIVDGKIVEEGYEDKILNVTVSGDVEELMTTSGDITAKNVGSIQSTSGDVNCGDVGGSIQTISGDVKSSRIAGSVSTVSGDVIR